MQEEFHEQIDFKTQILNEKKALIDKNVDKLSRISKKVLIIVGLRMVFVCLAMVFQEQFIAKRKDSRFAESWNAIFYLLSIMIDCLAFINELRILRFLHNQTEKLEQVKKKLDRNEAQPETALGSYQIYLSIYALIKIYRQRSRYQISISQSICYLQLFFTFYLFGQLAVNAQALNDTPLFKVAVLWVFMMSVYWTTFEVDFRALEGCKGPYIDRELCVAQSNQQQGESSSDKNLKQRYITSCRRPFEIAYIISILVMLSYLILYFQTAFHCYMMIACIIAHILELIYEKYLQNKLISKPLPKDYKSMNPYLIQYFCISSHKLFHLTIRTLVRIIIVLTIMAFFRLPAQELAQSLFFLGINFIFILGQRIKFDKMQSCKLYVLQPTTEVDLKQLTQCSICLTELKKSEKLLQLPCSKQHVFHFSCMQKWFNQRKECPLCRYSLDIYDMK